MNNNDFTPEELLTFASDPVKSPELRARVLADTLEAMRVYCRSITFEAFRAKYPEARITAITVHYQAALDLLHADGYRSKLGAHGEQENE